MMIRNFAIVAVALFLALTTGNAQQKEKKPKEQAPTLQAAAASVFKHQQELEACVRDNKTDDVKKHSQAMLKAAEQTKAAAEKQKQKLVATKAADVAKTARELVAVGKEGTIAENGQLIMKANDQALALKAAAAQVVQTTATVELQTP